MPTLNLQVNTTGNDGYSDTGGAFDSASAWIGDNANNEETIFAYFTSVTIPKGSTINSADFVVRRTGNNGTVSNVDTVVRGEAADNPSAPTTQAQHAARTRTSAGTNFDPTTWTAGGDETISVTAVVQEIINRSGWASGNTLGILWDTRVNVPNGDELQINDYTTNASLAPKLNIDYSPPSRGLLLLGVG